MNANKHTPGPWTISKWKGDKPGATLSIMAKDKTFIADVVFQLSDEEMPNARLIAAAPELLAALEALEGYTDVFTEHHGRTGRANEVLAQAKAAISKASK